MALSGAEPTLGWIGLGWCVLLVGLLIADKSISLRAHDISARREIDGKLSLGAENEVHLHVENRSRWWLQLTVKDDPPTEFTTPERARELRVAPLEDGEVSYRTTPPKRGRFTFGAIHVRGRSLLGLCQWQRSFDVSQEIDVYPDILAVRRYDLLLRAHQLESHGFRRSRVRGAGTEFESLREYVPDDEYRRVDWKATARRGKPYTRQYQEERSRTIMLMIDAGRMMSAEIEGMSKLDYAINAALMVAYVAIRRDDAVGLIVFTDEVKAIVPPRKGRGQVQRITQALYAVQPELTEPDYRAAMYHLHDRARKRSLAVLFTDIIDDQASRRLIANFTATYPRHLPLLVTMSDPALHAAAVRPPKTDEDVFERAAAASVLLDRERAQAALRGGGAVVLETEAGELTLAVVNQYLELKERMRI